MNPRLLEDGNFLRVQREKIDFSRDTIVTIRQKGNGASNGLPDLVLNEDEWKDLCAAVDHDTSQYSS